MQNAMQCKMRYVMRCDARYADAANDPSANAPAATAAASSASSRCEFTLRCERERRELERRAASVLSLPLLGCDQQQSRPPRE